MSDTPMVIEPTSGEPLITGALTSNQASPQNALNFGSEFLTSTHASTSDKTTANSASPPSQMYLADIEKSLDEIDHFLIPRLSTMHRSAIQDAAVAIQAEIERLRANIVKAGLGAYGGDPGAEEFQRLEKNFREAKETWQASVKKMAQNAPQNAS